MHQKPTFLGGVITYITLPREQLQIVTQSLHYIGAKIQKLTSFLRRF